jgi:hypothetical protein
MGTAAISKTATRRKAIKESVTGLPAVQGVARTLIEDLIDPHFIAEDHLIAAERALASASDAERKIGALQLHAAEKSQVGSAADRVKWSQAFDRFRWELRDAQAVVERARAERDEASRVYYEASGNLQRAVATVGGA